ncbi:hypothetical protein PM082_017965 [Marasmius tenuissimus]|nr:hypothetical protein PM082_017965 [Marasmius tenuissimus]
MAQERPAIPADIVKLTGPIYLGNLFNWGLFGALSVQTYIYYLGFPHDRWVPKGIVAVVFTLELVQTVLATKDGFDYFGAGWGDMTALDKVGLLWISIPVMTALLSCLVQFFFSWRIWIIGRSIYVPIVIIMMSLVQLAGGLWTGINAARIGSWSHLQEHNEEATIVWLGGTAACDILVTAAMFYCLSKSRNGFRATNALLVKFIRLTVETGLLTSTFAVLDLLFFLVFKGDNYHLVPATCLSKFYSNSLMVLLNARIRILNGRQVGFTTTDETLSWMGTNSTMSQQHHTPPTTYHLEANSKPANRGVEISVTTSTDTGDEPRTRSSFDDDTYKAGSFQV